MEQRCVLTRARQKILLCFTALGFGKGFDSTFMLIFGVLLKIEVRVMYVLSGGMLEMKEIHKPYICLIYGKWYQHIFRYCLLVNINGYHHIIWKRVSSYALLCCGIVENVCTLVRGEEGPRVPIPSLQTIKCSFLNFSILEGYWLCIGVVLTTLVNEMVPE